MLSANALTSSTPSLKANDYRQLPIIVIKQWP